MRPKHPRRGGRAIGGGPQKDRVPEFSLQMNNIFEAVGSVDFNQGQDEDCHRFRLACSEKPLDAQIEPVGEQRHCHCAECA